MFHFRNIKCKKTYLNVVSDFALQLLHCRNGAIMHKNNKCINNEQLCLVFTLQQMSKTHCILNTFTHHIWYIMYIFRLYFENENEAG